MLYIVSIDIHDVSFMLFCTNQFFVLNVILYYSGMFPLYKSGACNMGGGYIRAHISIKPQFGRKQQVRLCYHFFLLGKYSLKIIIV